jgi:hypothetical protein
MADVDSGVDSKWTVARKTGTMRKLFHYTPRTPMQCDIWTGVGDDALYEAVVNGDVSVDTYDIEFLVRNEASARLVCAAVKNMPAARFVPVTFQNWYGGLLHHRYVAAFPYVPRAALVELWRNNVAGVDGHRTFTVGHFQTVRVSDGDAVVMHPGSGGVALLVLCGLVTEPVGRQMMLDLVTFPR